jgi:dimethylsulfoniopropionate demethylase
MDPDVPLIVPQVNPEHLNDIKNQEGNLIGDLRSACYSPHFKKVIGIAMIKEPFCKASETGKLEIEGKTLFVKVCDLPFI